MVILRTASLIFDAIGSLIGSLLDSMPNIHLFFIRFFRYDANIAINFNNYNI